MAHVGSIVVAFIFHFIFRYSLFLEFHNHNLNHLSMFPSVTFLISICMILHDNTVIPERYKRKGSSAVYLMIETIMCLFIMELMMSLVWSRIEVTLAFVLKMAMEKVYGKWTDTVINSAITFIAAMFLGYVASVTNNMEIKKIFNKMEIIKNVIQNYFQQRNPCQIQTPVASPVSCPMRPVSSRGDGIKSRSTSKTGTRRC